MLDIAIHHVAVPTTDLAASSDFYEKVLGLKPIKRPPFSVPGVWYGIGRLHIHVVLNDRASLRAGKPVDSDDIHFALTTTDFEGAARHLMAAGYDETLPADHPRRMIMKREGLAGFPQLYVMDPDRNIIEINQAPFIGD